MAQIGSYGVVITSTEAKKSGSSSNTLENFGHRILSLIIFHNL